MRYLLEYGEKNIINNIIYDIFPYLRSVHGDAINIEVDKFSSLSFSTDPCPAPIINFFDNYNYYYNYGFLTVVINYSDLAASGSEPIGILLSTVMPNQMTDYEYRCFLNGVRDACELWGGKLLGGNIKDGKNFSVTGTSIGGHTDGVVLTRRGLQPGDLICTIGDLGMFWFGILQLMEGVTIDSLDDYTKSFILTPRPKILESQILAKSHLVSTCMDNSDGIVGCLYELSELNNLTIYLENEKLIPNFNLKQFCERKKVDYRNLLLSFGGWDLVFACNPKNVLALQYLFALKNLSFNIIGYAEEKTSENVILNKDGKRYRVKNFSSKRFDNHSYFSFGLDSFIQQFYLNNFEELSTTK